MHDGRDIAPPQKSPRRILVAQTTYLGDLVLSLPLLSALHRLFPETRIEVLVNEGQSEVVRDHPAVSHVLEYEKRGRHRGPGGFVKILREVRSRGYDASIVLPGSMRTALLPLLARVPRRIGFEPCSALREQMKHVRHPAAMRTLPFVRRILFFEHLCRLTSWFRGVLPPLFTDTLQNRPDEHAARRWLGTMHPFGVPAPEVPAAPWLPAQASIDARVGARFPSLKKGRVVIAPGGSQPTRRWPEEHFARLAQVLAVDEYAVYVLGGNSDRELCKRIAAASGLHTVSALAGELSFAESLSLIRQSVALVANDSAPVHMASAVGVPTVALFGPTLASFGFAPLAPGSRVIERSGLPCRPCTVYGSVACPIGTHECLKSIPVEDVRAAVHAITMHKSGCRP